jgi:hypothetical protein
MPDGKHYVSKLDFFDTVIVNEAKLIRLDPIALIKNSYRVTNVPRLREVLLESFNYD